MRTSSCRPGTPARCWPRRFSTSGGFPECIGPGIAIVIPTKRGPTVLIDAGANADARPEHLVQFAYMGSVFAEEILGVERPEVRLMSIGEEDEKGNQLTIEAHELLRASDLRFGGNMEGRLLLEGGADVVVADGFTGNVALKTLEGTIRTLLDALRTELGSSIAWEARRAAHPAPVRGGSGSASTRRRTAAATCSASTASSSSHTGRAPASQSRMPSVSARAESSIAWSSGSRSDLSSGVLESARSTTPTAER